MSSRPPVPPSLSVALSVLRQRARALPVVELARRLFALEGPLEAGVARRLVATALGRRAEELPDPIPAALLAPPGSGEGTPIEVADFAVVDLETTGLAADRAAIIEIGAVRVSGLRIAGRFDTLASPGTPVPPPISALTGIDDRMLEGAPPQSAALARFRAWLDAAPGAPFVAHNASFDARFVRRGLGRHGLPPLSGPVLCTRRLAARLLPGVRRRGLDALCGHLGIRNRARHRALGDAEATAELLVWLLERARDRAGLATLGELAAFQALPAAQARRRLDPGRSAGPRGTVAQPGGPS